MDASDLAQRCFETHIQENSYPGRGLVIGRSGQGQDQSLRDELIIGRGGQGQVQSRDVWLMVYWIMGRSAASRNRHFVVSGSTVKTEPVDTARMERPELLIYEAMLELPGLYLVSNGDQTRTVYETLHDGGTFDAALGTREREPDAPHYTPRISGMLDLRQDT